MLVNERIARLREEMETYGMDVYIVPTADFHQSEYVGEYFKCREYMTGFTGSAGTAVFTQKEACLWTDGRYFIQAAEQLRGTEIKLQKMGEPGVPSIQNYLKQTIAALDTDTPVIGFDGRTVSISQGETYRRIAENVDGRIMYMHDLVGKIWEKRPEMSCEPVFTLDEAYAGEYVSSKLARLRAKMMKKGAEICVITSLDDIGWLFNLRGNDVDYCPLILSYAIVYMEHVELFADYHKFSGEIQENLRKNNVIIRPYEEVYDCVRELTEAVMIDPDRMNYALYRNLPKQIEKVECECPLIVMKAKKNQVEIENIRKAHLKDGVACTKFMYWLKNAIGNETLTELSVSDKMEDLRSEQEHYLGQSFGPICAYKEHAAIAHYSCTPKTNVELKTEGLLLCDTGGHYLEGSTDITRTFSLGTLTEQEKVHFTTVLCSMLKLASATFLYGSNGMTLDYAAREPFWRQHLNYNHGTGHGVGYLGNIHEPPARFFWNVPAETPQKIHVLEPGMVITDEPGIYIENSHGIRIENELLVCEDMENEYGKFLKFEVLTFAPIDLDAVLPELMTESEKELLNQYHKQVYEKISPYLEDEEKQWLAKYTREI